MHNSNFEEWSYNYFITTQGTKLLIWRRTAVFWRFFLYKFHHSSHGKPYAPFWTRKFLILLSSKEIAFKATSSFFLATYMIFQKKNVSYLKMKGIKKLVLKLREVWEGFKIWNNLPPVLTKQLFSLSSVKTSGRFFQIFVAYSEKHYENKFT